MRRSLWLLIVLPVNLYWLKPDGETAPPPSAMEQIDPADIAKELEAEPGEAFVNIITVDVSEYAKTHFEKSEKKH